MRRGHVEKIFFGAKADAGELDGVAAGDEEAFDAVVISDAYLDMVLFAKAGVGVEKVAFPEDGFDGVEGSDPIVLDQRMDLLNDGAV